MTDKTKNSDEPKPEPEGKRSLVRHPLTTLAGLIHEAARVYRQMRDDKLDQLKGRSLIWSLGQMRAMVETQALERLEDRLEELAPQIEGRGNGYSPAARASRTAH